MSCKNFLATFYKPLIIHESHVCKDTHIDSRIPMLCRYV
jgi:hypothetical protein